jgi:hypothetical protein
MVRDGLVLGFSSRVSENVQKGWIPLSESTPVKRTSFSGRFGPSAESETEMPGFEIVCQDGEVAKCACSSEEEADEIVDKIVAWSKEKRPQMSSTAAKLRQKYNTSSPSVQGGNRSTGEWKAVATSSLFPPPPHPFPPGRTSTTPNDLAVAQNLGRMTQPMNTTTHPARHLSRFPIPTNNNTKHIHHRLQVADQEW